MQTADATLKHALEMFERSAERLKELEMAADALGQDNQYRSAVRCRLTVAQGTAWEVDVPATQEFIAPLIKAELIQHREAHERMRRKLEAARTAMQTEA